MRAVRRTCKCELEPFGVHPRYVLSGWRVLLPEYLRGSTPAAALRIGGERARSDLSRADLDFRRKT